MLRFQRFSGPVTLAVAGTLMAGTINAGMAQPDPSIAGKAANPPEKQRKPRKLNVKNGIITEARLAEIALRLAEREIQQWEEILGQKLTETQKKAVTQSVAERYKALLALQQKHRTNVAQALGTTVEELTVKEKAYQRLHKGERLRNNAAINRRLLRGGAQ